ncbi:protein ALP1-like [Pieris napi]|uniref:protein ALP1-like n=1 Tax=Pieris napi TaxID=78633 RepID=UPI001FBBC4AA|nr:protein ALP1-like [Pieris napi]
MSSDSSDEEALAVFLFYRNRRRQRKSRKYWIHPYIERNINCRVFVAAQELQHDDKKFLSFYRMSKETYLHLVTLLKPAIHQLNTKFRECVSAEERIMITLRYLGSGCTFVSLGLYFARGDNTICKVIAEMTVIIWEILNGDYMALPDVQHWKDIAARFDRLWNLPNCLGACDGKHIRIEKLPDSGSSNFNYKSYHSIVLMACCDSDGLFTVIETGYAGRNSDGGIFSASRIKRWIEHGRLNIPLPSKLPNDQSNYELPYYFIGDEAFPLLSYLMRPYPQRTLNDLRRVFNYRLSRGRNTIECAFGMMAEKFQVLSTAIRCHTIEKVSNIIKAVCILHNYVRKREGILYSPREFIQNRSVTIPVTTTIQPHNIEITANMSPHNQRNYLANYFISEQGSLPWQYQSCLQNTM